jgi:hypothetical protein
LRFLGQRSHIIIECYCCSYFSRAPIVNSSGSESQPCPSNIGTVSPSDPLNLFHSPAFYQSTSSPPRSTSSAQSYSGIVPITSYQSPLVASAHRHAKASLNMSTESDTDPETSPTSHDLMPDANFLRAAASGGSASAALLQTLSGRVHHLMSRVGGNSSLNARLQQYIQGMQVSNKRK